MIGVFGFLSRVLRFERETRNPRLKTPFEPGLLDFFWFLPVKVQSPIGKSVPELETRDPKLF
jgi:hypothetical protein